MNMSSTVSIRAALRAGFTLLIDNMPLFLALLCVSGAGSLAIHAIAMVMSHIPKIFAIAFGLAVFYLNLLFSAYMNIIALALVDGKKIDATNWRTYLAPINRVFTAEVAYLSIIMLGCMLFLIPGLYFGAIYYFMVYELIDDNNLTVGAALTKSAQLSYGNRLKIVGYIALSFFLEICSFSLLLPLVYISAAHMYRQLKPRQLF